MSRISARGFAVASATAVTTVGAVMGVAQGSVAQPNDDAEATAGESTLLSDLPVGQQAQVQTASLTQQAGVQAIAADTTAKKAAEESARKQAAKDAVSKQKAAVAKAKAVQDAKDKAAAETKATTEVASTSSAGSFPQQASYTVAEVQAIARQMVPSGQFQCFSNIVDHESTWNYQAVNPSSGAYGLVQAYPGSKMSSAGADWRTNPATQIKWGLNYMNDRYGSPCDAWNYWLANGSY
ncbi:transglycosylase SLT domain-containing protein [Streptomyces asoensis]|uniref:Transglycosylase SLT domain-containing protein n=1 Tax=Streptomyces asoensis TaxID=249586 RepID=A0A6M4WV55_9ACTN|nr:transglycosylase SLT domain-containing protein [Streptomyces asoensis]QJT03792.1 transglycosylase SLT domain-containing protein [Streptomyces asoensis]